MTETDVCLRLCRVKFSPQPGLLSLKRHWTHGSAGVGMLAWGLYQIQRTSILILNCIWGKNTHSCEEILLLADTFVGHPVKRCYVWISKLLITIHIFQKTVGEYCTQLADKIIHHTEMQTIFKISKQIWERPYRSWDQGLGCEIILAGPYNHHVPISFVLFSNYFYGDTNKFNCSLEVMHLWWHNFLKIYYLKLLSLSFIQTVEFVLLKS